MADTWDDARAAAMKILGPKGKIPKPSPGFINSAIANGKSWEEFDEARKKLKEKYDAHQKDFDRYMGAQTAYKDDIEQDNLGLDPKDKAENRKIVEARKLLVAATNKLSKKHEDQFNKLNALSGNVTSIMKYDEPS